MPTTSPEANGPGLSSCPGEAGMRTAAALVALGAACGLLSVLALLALAWAIHNL